MEILGGEEHDRRVDPGHDRLCIAVRFLQYVFRSPGRRFLLGGMKENGGAILRAPIRPLPVELGGIMILPEDFQQLFVSHLGGIEFDFHRFGVPGAVSANFFVGRIFGLAANIANPG